jgi:hypothetical protein
MGSGHGILTALSFETNSLQLGARKRRIVEPLRSGPWRYLLQEVLERSSRRAM